MDNINGNESQDNMPPIMAKIIEGLRAVRDRGTNLQGERQAMDIDLGHLIEYCSRFVAQDAWSATFIHDADPEQLGTWLLAGLEDLHKAVRGQKAPQVLADFVTRSTECEELQAIWDAQLMVCIANHALANPHALLHVSLICSTVTNGL